jgi:hypothetical protein
LHIRSDLFRNFAASIVATLMVQASLHKLIQSHWQHWRLADSGISAAALLYNQSTHLKYFEKGTYVYEVYCGLLL